MLSPLTLRIILGCILGALIALPLQAEYSALQFADDLQWLPALMGFALGGSVGFVAWLLRNPLARLKAARPGLLSMALVALMLCGFALEYSAGILNTDFSVRLAALLKVGGFAPSLIRDGQFWRVLSAPLLCNGTLHLLVAVGVLLMLVPMLRRRLHPTSVMLIFFGGPAVATLVVAAMVTHGVALLASAGAFSLFGGLVMAEWVHRDADTVGPKPAWWVVICAILMTAGLTPLGHGGVNMVALGAGAGLVAAESAIAKTRLPVRGLVLAGLLSLGAMGAVAVVLGAQAVETNRQDTLRVADNIQDSQLLNETAWDIAIAPSSDVAQLDLALKFSERSLELDPDRSQFRDTLATLHYRLGHNAKAAQTEFKAAIVYNRPFFWSQVQRFLAANRAETGQPLFEGESRSESLQIEQRDSDSGEGSLIMWWPKGTNPTAILQLMGEEQTPLGTIMLVGTGSTTGSHRFILPPAAENHLAEGAELSLVWVRDKQPGTEAGITFAGHDTDVDYLP